MGKSVNFSAILKGKNPRETKLRPMDLFLKRGGKKTSQTKVKTIMMILKIQKNPHQRNSIDTKKGCRVAAQFRKLSIGLKAPLAHNFISFSNL